MTQSMHILSILLTFTVTLRAEAPNTGKVQLTFTQRSPFSEAAMMRQRMDPGYRNSKWEDYEITNQAFEAIVPRNYKSTVAHGLIVWVGVVTPPAEWTDILARHKMILVNCDHLGIQKALDAAHNMPKLYNIAADRIYISGFSAGGILAAESLHAFPDVFHGCFSMGGENYYHGRWTEDSVIEPTVAEVPTWQGPLTYEQLKKDQHLVLMTGENDNINEHEISESNYQALVLDGFQHVAFFKMPRVGHQLPDASWYDRALTALEQSKPNPAPTTAPTKETRLQPGQIAQARRLLATALETIDNIPAQNADAEARRFLQQLLNEYPNSPSAPTARELLLWIDRHAVTTAPAR
jgi:predicted esterase